MLPELTRIVIYRYFTYLCPPTPRSPPVPRLSQEALAALSAAFGRHSLHVATAQEDLAYALYVLEYSSGRFYKAREHAERAIRIIQVRRPTSTLHWK